MNKQDSKMVSIPNEKSSECNSNGACASSSLVFRKIRLAVSAIDGGAKLLGISQREMFDRLNKQGLIHSRLLGEYQVLHTQSEKWVIRDTVETLINWENA